MEDKTHIESIGFIIKKEKLSTLASESKYQELVLEDLDPFPGFYDQYFLPLNENELKPRSVFFILKVSDVCQEDEYIRMTMHLKREYNIKFDAVPGNLTLFNKPTPCIRVFMDDYNEIRELIDHYKNKGLVFAPNKDVKPYQSLIKLRRYFEMERMDKGIYHAADQHNTYYIEVPKCLEWDDFEQVTIAIRNNWDHKLYDAAQAAIYEKNGIVDMVRIYDKKTNLSNLQFLLEKYQYELSRY
ncbi:MAG TPA: hypothetical protein VF298_05040 [Bacteroidales bacterium]